MRARCALNTALIIVSILGCSPIAKAEDALEWKLAAIDAGSTTLPKDDVTVARFRSLLRQLGEKYPESQQQIGDMSAKAADILRDEEGISEKIVDIMEGMNQLLYSPDSGQHYANAVAYYLTLRGHGMSHDDAIHALRGILKAAGVN